MRNPQEVPADQEETWLKRAYLTTTDDTGCFGPALITLAILSPIVARSLS